MVLVPRFNTSTELSAFHSLHAVRMDTHTNTDERTSRQRQHPSVRVLLSPAGKAPRLLPAITLDVSQHASLPVLPSSLLPTLPHLVSSLCSASQSSCVTQVLLPAPPLPASLLSCYVLSSSSSVHSDKLASLQVSSGLSKHGWVAGGGGMRWVVLMEAWGTLHGNCLLVHVTHTHPLVALTHTQHTLSTCNHPLGEQCVFNKDLNICPQTGCVPLTKLD